VGVKERPFLILFGGAGRDGIVRRLIEVGYRIAAAVVPSSPSQKLRESIDRIRRANVPVCACGRSNLGTALAQYAGHNVLSIGFPYLLSREVLAGFPLALNIHPTLLPRYRGPASGAYVLINQERESGSTVHLIDGGVDTGPIVLQRRVPLTRFDTIRSLQRKVYSIEPKLVEDSLALLDEPGFAPIPQDESQASLYPKRRVPDDSALDPTKPLSELFDSIRACDPQEFPAFFVLEGQKICIRLWRPERRPEDGDDTL
jgi:methionyl-tRNA formyltransferase